MSEELLNIIQQAGTKIKEARREEICKRLKSLSDVLRSDGCIAGAYVVAEAANNLETKAYEKATDLLSDLTSRYELEEGQKAAISNLNDDIRKEEKVRVGYELRSKVSDLLENSVNIILSVRREREKLMDEVASNIINEIKDVPLEDRLDKTVESIERYTRKKIREEAGREAEVNLEEGTYNFTPLRPLDVNVLCEVAAGRSVKHISQKHQVRTDDLRDKVSKFEKQGFLIPTKDGGYAISKEGFKEIEDAEGISFNEIMINPSLLNSDQEKRLVELGILEKGSKGVPVSGPILKMYEKGTYSS